MGGQRGGLQLGLGLNFAAGSCAGQPPGSSLGLHGKALRGEAALGAGSCSRCGSGTRAQFLCSPPAGACSGQRTQSEAELPLPWRSSRRGRTRVPALRYEQRHCSRQRLVCALVEAELAQHYPRFLQPPSYPRKEPGSISAAAAPDGAGH